MPPGGKPSTDTQEASTAQVAQSVKMAHPAVMQFPLRLGGDVGTDIKLEEPLILSPNRLVCQSLTEDMSFLQLVNRVTQHFIGKFVESMPQSSVVYGGQGEHAALINRLASVRHFNKQEFFLFSPWFPNVSFGQTQAFYDLLAELVNAYHQQQLSILSRLLDKVPAEIKKRTARLRQEMDKASFSIYEQIVVIEQVNLLLSAESPLAFDIYLKRFRQYAYEVQGAPSTGYKIVSGVMLALASGLSIAALAGVLSFGVSLGLGIASLYFSSSCLFFSYGRQKGTSKSIATICQKLPSTQSPYARLKSMFPKLSWFRKRDDSAGAVFKDRMAAFQFLNEIKDHAASVNIQVEYECIADISHTIQFSQCTNDKLIDLADCLDSYSSTLAAMI